MWRNLVLCGVALAIGACEQKSTVGSACKNGVCPQANAVQTPPCLIWNWGITIAIAGGAPLSICGPSVHKTGNTVDCRVYWAFGDGIVLPSGGALASCQDLPFLTSADARARTPFLEPNVCLFTQVAAPNGQPEAGTEGWYYDDQPSHPCPGGGMFRVTSGVEIPDGVSVSAVCTSANTVDAKGAVVPTDVASCKLPADSAKHAAAVGDACKPQTPAGGFDDREAYLESGSSQCETGACLVYHVRGDPTHVCSGSAMPPDCANAAEIDSRVYCSCRCDAPAGDPKGFCTCPQDFSCVSTLQDGPIGVRGSYCVRHGPFFTTL